MPEIADIERDLAIFLDRNPSSKVAETKNEERGSVFSVVKPWNDSTIDLEISGNRGEIVSVLNKVCLPERFSAIWHYQDEKLEVAWTAFPLHPSQKELIGRSFVYRSGANTYDCVFGDASTCLLTIAEHCRFKQFGPSQSRNMQTFKSYQQMKDDKELEDFVIDCRPLSFWINNVKQIDDQFISDMSHLNFYLVYFDRQTPKVMIHPPKPKRADFVEERYVIGSFPKNITAKRIDDNILHYWDAASEGDAARRFLYYYRIIEYSASLFIDQGNRIAMKRALAAPNALDDIDKISDEIMNISARMKMDEYARFEAMLKEAVPPSVLWKVVDKHRGYFSVEQIFDGGFKIDPIIGQNTKEEDYSTNAIMRFVRSIRDIRNALSHGKDQKTQSVILPTAHNIRSLAPWVTIIAHAAGELILHRT